MSEEDLFECYIDDTGYIEIKNICQSVNKSIHYFLDKDEIKKYIFKMCTESNKDFDDFWYYDKVISDFIFVHPKLALKVCEIISEKYKKYLEERIEEFNYFNNKI